MEARSRKAVDSSITPILPNVEQELSESARPMVEEKKEEVVLPTILAPVEEEK